MSELIQFLNNCDYKYIGVTGNAGAGKTSLLGCLEDDIFSKYSIDWRFIGDSAFRKQLLKMKSENSIHSYIDACNQFNWWDWNQIFKDFSDLKLHKQVAFNAYDRDTGSYKNVSVSRKNKKIVFEGALLGPEAITQDLDTIIFIYTPRKIRFDRIFNKDIARRNISEIISRFLITEYSESMYHEHLINCYKDKIFYADSEGSFIPKPSDVIASECFIPLPI
jgi:uridine kinase